jgi:hypothetical protein
MSDTTVTVTVPFAISEAMARKVLLAWKVRKEKRAAYMRKLRLKNPGAGRGV